MYFCSVQIKQFHYFSRNRFFKIFKQGLKPLEQFYSCIMKDSLMVEKTGEHREKSLAFYKVIDSQSQGIGIIK